MTSSAANPRTTSRPSTAYERRVAPTSVTTATRGPAAISYWSPVGFTASVVVTKSNSSDPRDYPERRHDPLHRHPRRSVRDRCAHVPDPHPRVPDERARLRAAGRAAGGRGVRLGERG